MSALPCPECLQVGFTWSIDVEQPNLTRWGCALCRYTAEEDESEQRRCPSCGADGAIRLRDPSGSYLFCTRCRLRRSAEL
jgi:ssDNA-binding Zn-finger/Zn-ribbon topoisomerase 1